LGVCVPAGLKLLQRMRSDSGGLNRRGMDSYLSLRPRATGRKFRR
jgi:hypothetical protein